jgi:polysaccharide deacetylase 2 family uncharacterized protein YibQ
VTSPRGTCTAPHSITRNLPGESTVRRLPVFAFSLFILVALFIQGCAHKSLSPSQRRAVTSEIVSTVEHADRKTQISIRQQTEDSDDLLTRSHVVDRITFSVTDRSRLPALRSTLARIARHHGLSFFSSTSDEDWRFEFAFDGSSTHEILVTLPTTEHAHVAPVPLPQTGPTSSPQPAKASRPKALIPAQSPSDARLAIILDDMGNDEGAAKALLELPVPLTFSVLPGLPSSSEVAEDAYRRGDQVMLHLPMQSQAGDEGQTTELRVGMNAGQVKTTIAGMLQAVPHVIGVNNHEGSRATADPALMNELMPLLRERNLFFIDSRTTAATVAYEAAAHAGVPAASRKVFLDDNISRDAILAQLDIARQDALRDGSAIAIGHPHAATIQALSEALPRLRTEGVRLVFVSELVH